MAWPGPATPTTPMVPSGVTIDSHGNLYIADTYGQVVRRVDAATGVTTVVAGNGTVGFSGDNGPATSAELDHPAGLAVDAAGDLFIADSVNNRVRRVDATTGVITTAAGTGVAGFSGDAGPATSAELYQPRGLAVDAKGNLFIADTYNSAVRRVDAVTGDITTVAGTGACGFSGDGGLATSAQLCLPYDVAVSANGDLFIADSQNNRVRQMYGATGVIFTMAGGGFGTASGGSAFDARFSDPTGVAVGPTGDVFIADTGDATVWAVTGGIIFTEAGTGSVGFSGDGGKSTSAQLSSPASMARDSAGNLFLADIGNNRVRRIDGTNGVITTVAGNGTS